MYHFNASAWPSKWPVTEEVHSFVLAAAVFALAGNVAILDVVRSWF
jgi:hypothetical protein